MIGCVAAGLQDLNPSPGCRGDSRQHSVEIVRADVPGAATRDENSSRPQHRNRQVVEAVIRPERGLCAGLSSSHFGWIEDDRVELSRLVASRFEILESIGPDAFNLFGDSIGFRILSGRVQSGL